MSLGFLVENYYVLLFIFARILPMFFIVPLLSTNALPFLVKAVFSMMIAVIVLPSVVEGGYYIPNGIIDFFLYLVGEILIGVLLSFLILAVFTVFQLSGQFFTVQMGLSASNVFDPLGQIQAPIMGQFFNLAASYLFIVTRGFNKLFFIGVYNSFKFISPISVMDYTSSLSKFFIGFLGVIFKQAFIISLPIIGTLFLCSLTLGLLAKAAPQMNLLMLGFPINIGVAFLIIIVSLPYLLDFFSTVFDGAFSNIQEILNMGGSVGV